MSKNQLLVLGSVLGLVFAGVRFWSIFHEEPAFVPYEDRMGRELAVLVAEAVEPGKVVVLLPDFDGLSSPIQEARFEGVKTVLRQQGEGWLVEAALVQTDPMVAQTGGDVFTAAEFLKVVEAHSDAVAIVSLVGPPGGHKALRKAWGQGEGARPAVVVMAVFDESLGPLLRSGIVDAVIAPRHKRDETFDFDSYEDPYEARFHLEYEIRRAPETSK